jgi:hypothetical protein
MRDSTFGKLAFRLLRGGVAPSHVRRIVAELQVHYSALVDEERQRGASQEDADADASAKIGSDDQIASDTLAQPSLKSWGARWPWAICGVGPALGCIVSQVLLTLMALAVLAPLSRHAASIASFKLTSRALDSAMVAVCWFVLRGLPLICALGLLFYAARRRLPLLWPLIGTLLVATLPALCNLDVQLPQPGALGLIRAGAGFSTSMHGLLTFAVRWVPTMGIPLLTYLWWRTAAIRAGLSGLSSKD